MHIISKKGDVRVLGGLVIMAILVVVFAIAYPKFMGVPGKMMSQCGELAHIRSYVTSKDAKCCEGTFFTEAYSIENYAKRHNKLKDALKCCVASDIFSITDAQLDKCKEEAAAKVPPAASVNSETGEGDGNNDGDEVQPSCTFGSNPITSISSGKNPLLPDVKPEFQNVNVKFKCNLPINPSSGFKLHYKLLDDASNSCPDTEDYIAVNLANHHDVYELNSLSSADSAVHDYKFMITYLNREVPSALPLDGKKFCFFIEYPAGSYQSKMSGVVYTTLKDSAVQQMRADLNCKIELASPAATCENSPPLTCRANVKCSPITEGSPSPNKLNFYSFTIPLAEYDIAKSDPTALVCADKYDSTPDYNGDGVPDLVLTYTISNNLEASLYYESSKGGLCVFAQDAHNPYHRSQVQTFEIGYVTGIVKPSESKCTFHVMFLMTQPEPDINNLMQIITTCPDCVNKNCEIYYGTDTIEVTASDFEKLPFICDNFDSNLYNHYITSSGTEVSNADPALENHYFHNFFIEGGIAYLELKNLVPYYMNPDDSATDAVFNLPEGTPVSLPRICYYVKYRDGTTSDAFGFYVNEPYLDVHHAD